MSKIIDRLESIPYIKKENFSLLFPDIKSASFDQNLKNWLKRDLLIRLKRGFYVPASYWHNCHDKDSYLFFLAALLFSPSYVSKETVLARYGILSEAVFGVAAVTSQATKNYRSQIANFSYSKIKAVLFTGYKQQEFNGKSYYMATKSKALFDYLYFLKRTMKHINEKTVGELRLNLEVMSPEDWQEFEQYLQLARSEKMRRIYKILRGENAL